jgi:hypothetical protein
MDPASFAKPLKTYREVPFWSWNDDLTPEELRRQIRLMDEGGWGGFFMHSRVGLKTPYLSKHWMDCVRTCVEEAKQRGMGAWLYDEDKWPSGYAGGMAAVDPAHRAQALICQVDNKPARLLDGLKAFVADRDAQGRLSGFTPLADLATFDGDRQSLVQFYVYTSPLGVAWFNGYCYINTLDPEAVRVFLESTHEVYAREFQANFGQGEGVGECPTIPGIFTDEPAYLNMNIQGIGVMGPGSIQPVPWVHDLPELFQRRWGYDLLENLPSLYFDTGDFARVRYHFWRLVTERFVEAFSKQIYDWCEAHHLPLTGHYLLEDNLYVQTRWIGAAMPHYEYEHIPGIDKLARNLFTALTVKQLDSVVCQLGKPRALCEGYGCTGQDFSFAGRKWIGDWVYVLGITLNNPHISLYSMRGERKRDYPANLFFQQPWWPENNLIADYFARLSYALSQGQRVVDLLVLHPMGSAWSRYRPDSTAAVNQLDRALTDLEQALLGSHRDFHYGDEILMEKYARVSADGPIFEVGQMRYQAVIVPPSHTWSANTARLLKEFAAAGGMILAVPPLPGEIEGQENTIPLPESTQVVKLEDLPAFLDQRLPYDVHIDAAPAIWYHHRRQGDMDWYFLANTNLESGSRACVQLAGQGRLEEWDPATGCVTPLSGQPGDAPKTTTLELDFAPEGSHLLVLHRSLPSYNISQAKPMEAAPTLALGDTWTLRLDELNTITLDSASVWDGRAWGEPQYILDAHEQVRGAGPGAPFSLRYTVNVQEVPPDPLYLVVETPEQFSITVNQERINPLSTGAWIDPCFRKIEISGKLKPGENAITLTGVFAPETELESIYLLGAFGVQVEGGGAGTIGGGERCGGSNGQSFYRYHPAFALTRLPQTVQSGDLVAQGLPFFAGRLHLSQEVMVEHPRPGGTLHIQGAHFAVARATVNGVEMGPTAWPPYAIPLGSSLRDGKNTVEIELVSTLRNLLGPHHLRHGDGEGIGPDAFRRSPDWTDDYVFVPFGMEGVEIGE